MEKKYVDSDKTRSLIQYYKNKGLLITGLNDTPIWEFFI